MNLTHFQSSRGFPSTPGRAGALPAAGSAKAGPLPAAAHTEVRAGGCLQREVLSNDCSAFSLIEVTIATAILFMCLFAILGVLSTGIHAASILRTNGPTPGMAASILATSNILEEGTLTGDFGEAVYPGWHWRSEAVEVATNGLFKVDLSVLDPSGTDISDISVLLYRPNSGKNRMGLQR